MTDFYENTLLGGTNLGNALVQASGSVGGYRHVFVKWQGSGKNGLIFPPIGGVLENPFKGRAKAYAGDLVEYAIDGTCKLLKTYVAQAASTTTTAYFVRDGYKHIPFVGDVLMKAPDTATGEGQSSLVTAVESTTNDGVNVWKVKLEVALPLAVGDILVEAKGSASVNGIAPLVQNPNAYLACDYDFAYDPTNIDDFYDGAKYLINPCIASEDVKLIISQMSPLPAYVKAMNKSLVDGWFNL